ncbi:MAG: NADH-quinone oxidoreductase subunit NuoN [Neisseriaceae bacterium]|nr:MAG: NADH-quinone oxidoreductase subunit NuoN [Neisseriaceae bacterium]
MTQPDWLILPDVSLLILLGLVLVIDLFMSDKNRKITEKFTLLGLIIIFIIQLSVTFNQAFHAEPILFFDNMCINDGLSNVSKLIMYILTFVALVYSRQYLKQQNLYKGEYYLLILFALLGMNIMVSSINYVMMFIGLELLSLALYALIALKRNSISSSEASLKYFILGSLASGILLFGISMIYGATGTLDMLEVFQRSQNLADSKQILLLLGVVFSVVGIAFKFGTVPFHMWVPDVYEGASTSVAMFVGTAPKIAVVVFAYRILLESLGTNLTDISLMLQIIAVASLLLGNIAAIIQTNIKRMLGYSTISHMGFIILGFSANHFQYDGTSFLSYNWQGFYSAMFYAITYVGMSSVAFAVLMATSIKEKECKNLSDLAGLNSRHPVLAFIMLLAMFSMAGIPPLVGFYAKFYVIEALIASQLTWLAVFAVLMSLIGAFYYLRVVKVMYFDAPEKESSKKDLDLAMFAKIFLGFNGLALLIFGIYPEPIIRLCEYMFSMSKIL